MKLNPLSPDALRWRCPENAFDFKKTDKVTPKKEIVGQERAVKAVRLGLEISSVGYNMFVTGISGTGRESTVEKLLDSIDTTTTDLKDICYVQNFREPQAPIALCFPAGDGSRFADTLDECVDLLKSNIPAVLNSERATTEKRAIIKGMQKNQKNIMQDVEIKAKKEGFVVVQIPVAQGNYRHDILPVIDENPANFEQLEKLVSSGKLTKADLDKYRKVHEKLFQILNEAFRRSHSLELKAHREVQKLYESLVKPTVDGILSRLKDFGNDEVEDYVETLKITILNNLPEFAGQGGSEEDPYAFFAANLVVDNSGRTRKPVVIEQFPDHGTLFGSVEKVFVEGNKVYTDFRMIRAGSMLKANGGYLIMDALDVIRQPGLWHALVQTLRNSTVKIQTQDPFHIYIVNLRPEPVVVDVKIILMGPSWLYRLLAESDPEFRLLFRIRADFDSRMPLEQKNLKDFANVIVSIVRSERIPPLTGEAMGAVAEQAVRLTGRQDKISTEFTRVADYVRQAAYWAKQEKCSTIKASHVQKAIDEKRYRLSLGEDYARESILKEVVMINTDGEAVGQVNGLAVYTGGDYAFGLPARVTAKVSVGREGIVNIEREADMSGPTHTKGVLIITGFLRGRYAMNFPLSLSASLCFEQSYGGVDGDSASSTELYALLSALSGLPIRQNLAVTGSVNQHGAVQAIGGVNEKIEGFFRICAKRGLTGKQGVLIPISNIEHLQLESDVIDAVEKGKFNIYPVSTIDQGIELLTGREAGERLDKGGYPAGSINELVENRLSEMAEILKKFNARS